MSSFFVRFVQPRATAIVALAAAAALAGPATLAYADSAATLMAQAAPAVPVSPASPTSDKPENVETRISNLKASLKITPDQEKKWNAVATVMRENAGKMEKLMTEKRGQAPGEMTAVDDLVTYQKFSQAHVDGLKKLTASFKVLYDAMPTPQKKNADMVFQSFGREPGKPAATKS